MAALGPVLILVSIPLLFGWVPRNRLYGFRVPATLRHDTVWYAVNARSAWHFLVLGAAMVALDFTVPDDLRTRILGAVGLVGLVVITIVNWRHANRLARRLDG